MAHLEVLVKEEAEESIYEDNMALEFQNLMISVHKQALFNLNSYAIS